MQQAGWVNRPGLLWRPLSLLMAGTAACFLAVFVAYSIHMFGLLLPIALFSLMPIIWALLWPRSCAFFLLGALIVVEPHALDATGILSQMIYRFPPAIEAAMPITLAPVEVLGLITLASMLMRARPERRALWRGMPVLALAIPGVMLVGIAYGFAKGAQAGLAYHEARGLIFAIVAFALAIELGDTPRRSIVRFVIKSTTLAAIVLLGRYFFLTRDGQSDVPAEFAYAHESVLLLVTGIAVGIGAWMAGNGKGRNWFLLLHSLLLLAAILVTGRRSGTLVVLVVGIVLLALLIRRQPLRAGIAGLVAMVLLSAYLGAFWNQQYGALAQPARAIRSQIDPSARDQSSDEYRIIERASIVQTIRSNPLLGVGFGKEFFLVAPLPDMTSYWPLQYHTPHQNVLWLWLKMGIIGISTVLGAWLLASARAVRAFWVAPRDGPFPFLPLVLMSMFAAYLCFATVDVTFASTRAMVPFGAALAIAFTQLPAWSGPRADVTDDELTGDGRLTSTPAAGQGSMESKVAL